ncbi:MAG: electron transfer flavoprotein subunit alpha/FixB family protein [Gammaproteobacteria bacterium]|nr:electron transfer flavoprotein subunit alpha/FixB family protein [Gammaproteobacteria bacterium]MYF02272.1 electron transfer flavoprotein subunit alpha/FixB family protein [Gammaproteobacteria bacterium]MYI76834.1 electron transfer flavoprotein subunit alpha/FixB family protein [Gammaproteobacteria bacterium]
MSTLVIADHDNSELKPVTRNTLKAASEIGDEIDVLIAGCECSSVVQSIVNLGVARTVHVADAPYFEHAIAENVTAIVVQLAPAYQHILTAHTTTGKNFLPRVAALLDVQMISDIVEVLDATTFKRPVYAGNGIATVKSNDTTVVLSVRGTAFDPIVPGTLATATNTLDSATFPDPSPTTHIKDELAQSERPELNNAKVVVSGGRALGSSESFAFLEELADSLGAAVGASRAAVDAGYVPNDMQVGQTGKIVAPELYIAVGISGAIQHLAGMKDSKVIVAINNDPDAPIFQLADYGLVADLFEVIPEFIRQIKEGS